MACANPECGKTFAAFVLAKFCSQSCRNRVHNVARQLDARNRSERQCRHCGVAFAPEYGNYRRTYCGAECQRVAHSRQRQRGGNGIQRAKRAGRLFENVDPNDIFERDRWRCKLCGCRVLPELLGNRKAPNAPEIDHILPLKAGGHHVRTNLQTACRRCNNRKGSRPLGQLLLIG